MYENSEGQIGMDHLAKILQSELDRKKIPSSCLPYIKLQKFFYPIKLNEKSKIIKIISYNTRGQLKAAKPPIALD